jgi:hypothetical protein
VCRQRDRIVADQVFLAKILWKFDLEEVAGPNNAMDMDDFLRGWAIHEKRDVRVKFLPVARGCM